MPSAKAEGTAVVDRVRARSLAENRGKRPQGVTAEKMKKMIQRTGAAYKEQSGALSAATLDRAENAITYRVFGREKERQNAYEENLSAYEKAAVRANIWNTAMPPVYLSLIHI